MSSAAASGIEPTTSAVTSRHPTATKPGSQTQPHAPNGSVAAVAAASGPGSPHQTPKIRRRKYRHIEAIHAKSTPSCLSSDAAEPISFRGFRNLTLIVLVVGNLRLMIENMQKYGVLVCIRCHDFRSNDVKLGLWLYVLIPVHLVAAFAIERFVAKRAKATRLRAEHETDPSSPTEDERKKFQSMWKTAWMVHAANVTIALAYTTYIVYFKIHHPLLGTLTMAHAIIVWLKTASYAFTNRDLRHAFLYPSLRGAVDALPDMYQDCPYPQNITLGNLVYFWWAPTLVYQPVYPRSDRIRWLFVMKRLGELVGLTVFMWFCSAQWAAPVLRNSLDKMASLDLFAILERLLKLSTISLVIWLAGFFALFQSFLNALAEITRFGDRDFYEPWWNSETLGTYWRTWNKPVYAFFRRHIYSPMRARGFSHKTASAVVFLISAILHEILVGAPTHNLIGIAFGGMLVQLPLITMTQFISNKESPAWKAFGNVIFWLSFTIFGQPFAALCYFYAWQAKYGSVGRMMDQQQQSRLAAGTPPSVGA